MNRERLNARIFGDAGNADCIAMLAIPTGSDLERHGNRHRANCRRQYPPDQPLVLEQGRARHDVADLLGRAAHVDVDNLGALIHIVLGRVGQHLRVGARDLHGYWLHFAFMIGAPPGLLRAPQQRVTRDHL